MARKLNLKVVINKRTGQLNISLPKKKLPIKLLKEINETKKIQLIIGRKK